MSEMGACGFPVSKFPALITITMFSATLETPKTDACSLIGRWGAIVLAGSKTLEFCEQFSNDRATVITANGKDILSVKMHLNSEGQAEEDAEVVTRE
jgi:hypothetical protein